MARDSTAAYITTFYAYAAKKRKKRLEFEGVQQGDEV